MPVPTGGEGELAAGPQRPGGHVTSRAVTLEPYFGSLCRALHAPPVGELLDDLQAPTTWAFLAPPAGKAAAAIEYPAADVAVDQHVEHHRDVALGRAVDDTVRDQLADHQRDVV